MGWTPRARAISGLALASVALVGLMGTTPAKAETATAEPKRVVSMNLCTDQLAMLVAAPGQLISVSYLARDPRSSAMAEEARAYPVNHGLAEQVYLLQPDLVIVGRYTTRATADMLERLGTPVIRFDIARNMEDVRTRIIEMGAALGQEARAEALVADFDAQLTALRTAPAQRPRAALYFANGYTSGDNTLAGQILHAAGFANIATELGYGAGGILPLELLALSEPDALITGQRYGNTSRAEAIMDHPAIHALRQGRAQAPLTDHDWVCGTPHVLRAIAEITALRGQIDAGGP
ncbi:ABC transporter substrate-binding protein [Roseovarius sp. LXJ103]|uniref:ABC transporter substrate-binding protein n=1 Tax=Roseovarius carneus TaxID=2853164 RepID=UPI001C6366AA|nr:ABC transporter substrate-binding protein [Roseovarius carneus]MBZ8118608.1 ABC transporter substrate-binding protein [Roseovarius carneus]